ncbi:hypothetical protein GCM10027445_61750 [Amycolatopsis endophytica]|uniref:Uncharacterized protein n=1 Tax=Amycolatopsis endophytica TaxID=860233 RepID=A0A853B507_9PSEU|nr:hypothetical protein [Amycolatopsis endophytica]NYI89676.1 hypothetical protein [Amycolatopsis endophytica]
MNFEDELNRLFQDERVDIPVRPGAELAVVAGARRRRRRRHAAAVTGGGLTIAVLAVAGIALGGVGGGRQDTLPATHPPVTTVPTSAESLVQPPASPTSPVSPPPLSSSAGTATTTSGASGGGQRTSRSSGPATSSQLRAASTDRTLGPTGWGRLTLGMSESAALATDEFDLSEGVSGSPCHRYWLRNGGSTPVDISPTYGVARIPAKPDVTTPEGFGRGSTDAEVMAAYPDATITNYTITTPVPGNAKAVYIFNTSPAQTISSLRLELLTHNC